MKLQGNPSVFIAMLKAAHVAVPEPEYKFHPTRKWRFDWAWTDHHVALEVEGGIWTGGRHIHAVGFVKDMEKYNAAAALGWRIIRCTPTTLNSNATLTLIKETLLWTPLQNEA